MKNLQLRKATADDREFAYQTRKAAFRGYVEQTSGWNEDEQRQLHQKRFTSQNFQVIQVSGLDIGILYVTRQPDYIKVSQLFILPAYQSRGIGGAAMMLIIKDAAASKLPIRLQVLKINSRALAFYQRLGFKRTGETDTHILMERLP